MSTDAENNSKPVRLTSAGLPGKLTAPSGEQLPVRVVQRTAEQMMLVLLVAAGGRLEDAPPSRPFDLEYTCARGLVRFQGEVVVEEEDLVRYEIVAAPEVVQRREFVRVEVSQPVVIELDGRRERLSTYVVDLSGCGMQVSEGERLELGSVVAFSLELEPDQPHISGRARVVRDPGDGKRGIAFEGISDADRQRLIHFVFDRQRAALAKTRGYTR